ncbi:MAG: glycosyltransferase family 4 protein, partial [Actinomycetota bacterium]
LSAALAERGIEQTIVTAYRPGAPRSQDVSVGCRVLRVGVPTTALRQLYTPAAVAPIVRHARRHDLVHVHLGEDLGVLPLGMLASHLARVPLVLTVHCSLRFTLERSDLRSAVLATAGGAMERWVERSADAIFVLTSRLEERLARSDVERSRIHRIPLGIDLDRFTASAPRPPELGRRRFVIYVGRLVREKGVHQLLEAFARQREPDVSLVFVGDGPERRPLEQRSRTLDVANRVRFTGAVAYDRIPAMIRHAEVLVLPSWYEELGRVLVEAMAAGVPVVATRAGGIPSIVEHGVNGILVPPRDPESLAEAIDTVLTDSGLAASLTDAGRGAARRHDLRALTAATHEAYEAVLGRETAPAVRVGVPNVHLRATRTPHPLHPRSLRSWS